MVVGAVVAVDAYVVVVAVVVYPRNLPLKLCQNRVSIGKDFVVDLVLHISAVHVVAVRVVVIDPRNLPLKFGQN